LVLCLTVGTLRWAPLTEYSVVASVCDSTVVTMFYFA
jgi:hypothetical protein